MSQFAQRASVTSLPACRCLHLRPVLLCRPARRLLTSHNIPFGCENLHSGARRRQHKKQSPYATAGSVTQTASVFPAGRTQARVKLPACILKIAATEVLQEQGLQDILSSATAGSITGVLLTDTSGSDGAALYEAACKLKEQLRGRAVLLIADRTDIVDAAEADGVILSSKGAAKHNRNNTYLSLLHLRSIPVLLLLKQCFWQFWSSLTTSAVAQGFQL